ncbi:MAG: hypothetical protein RDV41_15650, partial [Planctomycetota bacterium]|nr:hypothetical protein [Planctomycetota bacterium]
MNKWFACMFSIITLFLPATALFAQQPKPGETTVAAGEGDIYYVATVENEYAGREQISVSTVTEGGVKYLRFAYEAEFKTETTNMGFTSARGVCFMEEDGFRFGKATITRFNGPVTLADAEVVFAKGSVTTRTVGAEVPAVESTVAPDSKLRTSWMVERELLSNLPIEPGREIVYQEVTGVGDDAEALRQVKITVASKDERKYGTKTVDGWRLELRYAGASEELPLVLFVDNQARVLEKAYGNLVLTRVYTRDETLASKEYVFEQRGRRDPFIPRLVYVGKPERTGTTQKPPVTEPKAPPVSPEDAKRIVAKAQDVVAEMKRICETVEDDTEKDAQLGVCMKDLQEYRRQLAKTTYDVEKKKLEALIKEAETYFGRGRALLQEARECHDSAVRKFESEFYDKIAEDKKRL